MPFADRYRLLRILKFAAFVVSIFYIAWHFSTRPEFRDPDVLLKPFLSAANWWMLALVSLLMMLNWSIEAIKWKLLLESVEKIDFLHSLRAVFTGVTVSFYTPNRMGEFAGRILHLEPHHRVRGALATFVGGTAQVMITFQAGLLALVWFRNDFLPGGQNTLLVIPMLLMAIALPVIWLRIPALAKWKWMNHLLARYPKYLEVFAHFSRKQLMQIYILSAIRYLVFCTQQFLLLTLAGALLSWPLSLGLSALSFLFITVIPSIALGELGMRGGVNLYVFSAFVGNSAAILFSALMLWLINISVPALIGAFGFLYVKYRKR